jgi:hypothetical protein
MLLTRFGVQKACLVGGGGDDEETGDPTFVAFPSKGSSKSLLADVEVGSEESEMATHVAEVDAMGSCRPSVPKYTPTNSRVRKNRQRKIAINTKSPKKFPSKCLEKMFHHPCITDDRMQLQREENDVLLVMLLSACSSRFSVLCSFIQQAIPTMEKALAISKTINNPSNEPKTRLTLRLASSSLEALALITPDKEAPFILPFRERCGGIFPVDEQSRLPVSIICSDSRDSRQEDERSTTSAGHIELLRSTKMNGRDIIFTTRLTRKILLLPLTSQTSTLALDPPPSASGDRQQHH